MARKKKEKRKKVLLVDDNHETLEVIRHLINSRDERIDVVSSPSAEQGLLELFSLDVLVTDLRLPGMDGVDLIHRARRSNPDLPAIIISGLDEGHANERIGDLKNTVFVPKPYKPDHLIMLISQAAWGEDAPPSIAKKKAKAKPEPAVKQVEEEPDAPEPRSDVFHQPLSAASISRLERLQGVTTANQVILWSLDGTLLYVFDEDERRAAEKLGKPAISVIASGYEMLVRSGSKPTQLITVLDGEPHEIVLAYVQGDYCLAILVDADKPGSKLSTVWGAMQRAVVDLSIRLGDDQKRPSAEPIPELGEPAVEAELETPAEAEPEVELDPIASDEDLEALIDDLTSDEISDDELDDFWGEDVSAETPAISQANAQTEEPNAKAKDEVVDLDAQTLGELLEEDETVEAADIPGLENILSDNPDVLDERWEEVKGMLGLDSGADEFWDEAISNMEAESQQSAGEAGIMSYREAMEKGLLGDRDSSAEA